MTCVSCPGTSSSPGYVTRVELPNVRRTLVTSKVGSEVLSAPGIYLSQKSVQAVNHGRRVMLLLDVQRRHWCLGLC